MLHVITYVDKATAQRVVDTYKDWTWIRAEFVHRHLPSKIRKLSDASKVNLDAHYRFAYHAEERENGPEVSITRIAPDANFSVQGIFDDKAEAALFVERFGGGEIRQMLFGKHPPAPVIPAAGTPKQPHERHGHWATSKTGKKFWRSAAAVKGGRNA